MWVYLWDTNLVGGWSWWGGGWWYLWTYDSWAASNCPWYIPRIGEAEIATVNFSWSSNAWQTITIYRTNNSCVCWACSAVWNCNGCICFRGCWNKYVSFYSAPITKTWCVDFLIVWWGWWGIWYCSWWAWWGWGVCEAFQQEISWLLIPVTVWAPWQSYQSSSWSCNNEIWWKSSFWIYYACGWKTLCSGYPQENVGTSWAGGAGWPGDARVCIGKYNNYDLYQNWNGWPWYYSIISWTWHYYAWWGGAWWWQCKNFACYYAIAGKWCHWWGDGNQYWIPWYVESSCGAPASYYWWWAWGWDCSYSRNIAACQWIVIVRYKADWSYWITNATWWTKYLCNWYCIHCFTNTQWVEYFVPTYK